MSNFVTQWVFILASAVFFIAADSFAANWGKTGSKYSLLIFILIAPIGYVFFAHLNKLKSLSISSGIVNMLLILGNILIGFFYFNDVLTIKQIVGLVFAILAVVLMF